jgi:hypothetical protein
MFRSTLFQDSILSDSTRNFASSSLVRASAMLLLNHKLEHVGDMQCGITSMLTFVERDQRAQELKGGTNAHTHTHTYIHSIV